MTSDGVIAGTAGLAVIALAFALYFLPTIVATSRGHQSTTAIGVLNTLAGWTVVGWVGALVWALAGQTPKERAFEGANASAGERLCPFCAEKIKIAAIKCRHCGSDIPPPLPEAKLVAKAPRVIVR